MHPSVCRSVGRSVCVSVCLSLVRCLYVRVCVVLFICSFGCLIACSFVCVFHLCACLFACLFGCSSVRLFVCLFVDVFAWLFCVCLLARLHTQMLMCMHLQIYTSTHVDHDNTESVEHSGVIVISGFLSGTFFDRRHPLYFSTISCKVQGLRLGIHMQVSGSDKAQQDDQTLQAPQCQRAMTQQGPHAARRPQRSALQNRGSSWSRQADVYCDLAN